MNETRTFTRTAPPAWLLAFWKEIDDKTWGKGFDCFKEDAGALKVFRGFVTMKPNDTSQPTVKPAMTHFFYMDSEDPTKVAAWYGSVGPVAF